MIRKIALVFLSLFRCLAAESIPVVFSADFSLPMVEVEIEKNTYFLEIDSGAAGLFLSLRADILERINSKESQGDSQSMDVKGNVYTFPQFLLPKLKVHGYEFGPFIAEEESLDFLTKGSVFFESTRDLRVVDHSDGRLGLQWLRKHNWYFDLANSSLSMIEGEVAKVVPRGYVEVPFEITRFGIVISARTDLGSRKFVLDSCASASALKRSIVPEDMAKEISEGRWLFRSRKFILEGENFPNQKFWLLDVHTLFGDIDGILGVDFFKKYPIYLDFENRKAYIGPSQQSFLSRYFNWMRDWWYLGG
jgi:hypothetical protein